MQLNLMIHQNVHVSTALTHFKFPKVVVAHILGEVALYAQNMPIIFIEIGLYLTGTELKINRHVSETRQIISRRKKHMSEPSV